MTHIACLLVPDLPLAALLRAEPALGGRALVIGEGPGPRAGLLAVSPEARQAGVSRGMSGVQARSLVPDLVLRVVSAAQIRSAQAALLDVARSFSPRVALGPGAGSAAGGEVFLDAGGLERRFATAGQLGETLVRAASRVGLAVRVGLGPGPLTARLAALSASDEAPVRAVEAGEERAFLAPLPVSLLESSARVRSALERFGIERLGQLAALPAAGLGRRLGPEGLRLWRLARGEDRQPLIGNPPPERFLEESEPDWAIDRVEPLLHLLESLFERLAERLACRGLTARRVSLGLSLESGGVDVCTLEPAAPTRACATWRELTRCCLEQRPPAGPVTGIAVEAEPARVRGAQQDFFDRSGQVASQRFEDALAQLAVLAGEGRVGSPWLPDGYHPDAVQLVPLGRGGVAPALAARPAGIALRALRPPRAIRVWLTGQRPVSIATCDPSDRRLTGRVVRAAGPWRLDGGWWQTAPLSRDYYDVELASGCLVRLFRDRQADQWFIDGICG